MIYDLVGQQQRSWGRDLGNVSHSRSLSLIYFTIICDYLLTLLFSFIFFTLFIYDLALEPPFLLAEHQKLTNLPFIRPYFIVLSTIYCSVSVLNTLCLFRALRSIFCLSVEFILSLSFPLCLLVSPSSLSLSISLPFSLYLLYSISLYLNDTYASDQSPAYTSEGDDYEVVIIMMTMMITIRR